MNTRIAVLITCHNRKSKTLACLDALFKNAIPDDCSMEEYLVDDGSTDGTEQAVRELYPQVNIIKGDGNLYWNGGMRVAFSAAMEKGFDYYLWLNDDTILYEKSIVALLKAEQDFFEIYKQASLIVGSTQDKPNGKLTYGGLLRFSNTRPIRFKLVTPNDYVVPCDSMNGNCVLIPRIVAQTIGNLDENFIHTIGDIDYGLRAKACGFQLLVMPGFAGLCCKNSSDGTYNDTKLGLIERLKKVTGKKGLPFHAWYVFTRRHGGALWVMHWLWTYFSIIFSAIGLLRKNNSSSVK